MPDSSPDLCDRLICRFKATAEKVPDWAWPFQPPIPLVGRTFVPGKSLLIYASAENHSKLNNASSPPARFTTDQAWNRYRVRYEEEGKGDGNFFPNVGIQPVNDGGLLVAGLFVSRHLGHTTPDDPRLFIEAIAVTNWCKFSIRSATNTDYIADLKKLTPSLPFVVGELAVLQPAVVLVPAQVWAHPILAAAMRGASPWTKFLPIPQFNATVINCHLDHYHESAVALRERLQGDSLAAWMSQLRRLSEAAAWRYLACLDELLRATATAADSNQSA